MVAGTSRRRWGVRTPGGAARRMTRYGEPERMPYDGPVVRMKLAYGGAPLVRQHDRVMFAHAALRARRG